MLLTCACKHSLMCVGCRQPCSCCNMRVQLLLGTAVASHLLWHGLDDVCKGDAIWQLRANALVAPLQVAAARDTQQGMSTCAGTDMQRAKS
jgi:hypothetical protein